MSNIVIVDYAASLPPLYGIKKWNFSPENWNNFIISLETIARFEKNKAREHTENEKSMADHSNYRVAYQNAKNIFYSMLPSIKTDYYLASNDVSLVVEDTESNNSENASDISSEEEEEPQVIPYYAWEAESDIDATESHCESTSKPKMENVNYDNNDWDILINILETIKKLENKLLQQGRAQNKPLSNSNEDLFALKICCTTASSFTEPTRESLNTLSKNDNVIWFSFQTFENFITLDKKFQISLGKVFCTGPGSGRCARLGDRQISPIPMKLTLESHKILVSTCLNSIYYVTADDSVNFNWNLTREKHCFELGFVRCPMYFPNIIINIGSSAHAMAEGQKYSGEMICKFSYSSITLHESNLTGFFLFGNQRLRGEGKANDSDFLSDSPFWRIGKVLHRALSLAKTPDSDEFKLNEPLSNIMFTMKCLLLFYYDLRMRISDVSILAELLDSRALSFESTQQTCKAKPCGNT
uniref:Uncharacterized protein n=1 Tax=Glossina pallidipes TaxID=7398 RepID=A0A1A9Z5Q8_GLOPL